jgi:hypothetical protein
LTKSIFGRLQNFRDEWRLPHRRIEHPREDGEKVRPAISRVVVWEEYLDPNSPLADWHVKHDFDCEIKAACRQPNDEPIFRLWLTGDYDNSEIGARFGVSHDAVRRTVNRIRMALPYDIPKARKDHLRPAA